MKKMQFLFRLTCSWHPYTVNQTILAQEFRFHGRGTARRFPSTPNNIDSEHRPRAKTLDGCVFGSLP